MLGQRVIVRRLGGPEVLEVVAQERPEPGPGQVCVRVQAAGVAFADVMARIGPYPGAPEPPFTPGYDVAGVVGAVGPSVDGITPGQHIVALTEFGGYATWVCLPAVALVPAPAGLDPAEAVSLVLNYITAYQLLHRVGRVQSGGSVLVHGAGGGVGTALLELARIHGVRAFGTASRGKHEVVRSLGATPIDYRSEDFLAVVRRELPEGVDAAFDHVGGRHLLRSYRALKRGGRLALFGTRTSFPKGRPDRLRTLGAYLPVPLLFALMQKRFHIHSITRMRDLRPDWFREDLTLLLDWLHAGRLKPVVSRMPLAEVAQAHALLTGAALPGKIVLLPE